MTVFETLRILGMVYVGVATPFVVKNMYEVYRDKTRGHLEFIAMPASLFATAVASFIIPKKKIMFTVDSFIVTPRDPSERFRLSLTWTHQNR
jgi:hypothetical protein